MPTLTVRPAIPADLTRLADLWYEKTVLQQQADRRMRMAPDGRERWSAAAEAWMQDADAALLVAERDGAIIGYLVGRVEPNAPGLLPERRGVVSELALDAHRYTPNAGRTLLKAARAWFAAQGVEQIVVNVPKRHSVEQAFWRAAGGKMWIECLLMTSSSDR